MADVIFGRIRDFAMIFSILTADYSPNVGFPGSFHPKSSQPVDKYAKRIAAERKQMGNGQFNFALLYPRKRTLLVRTQNVCF
jgi:hypothetical protein